jgi:uncharacterized protein (TIGR03066 family)
LKRLVAACLLLGVLVVGGCATGAPKAAEAPATSKIVGTWTRQDGPTRTMEFRADGAYSERWSETEPGYDGRYTLEGDVLTLTVGETKLVARRVEFG